MEKLVTMSKKEITRLEVMQRIQNQELLQKEAAEILNLSERHIRRLYKAFLEKGAKALVSKHRGRPSNNRLDPELKQEVIDLLHSRYHDFGPTLAHEKLTEKHKLNLCIESVRQIMIQEGLWRVRRRKQKPVHQLRPRRACFGELIQIDGSPHAWFEDRGPRCNLLAFIDDATGCLGELFFTPEETTFAYFTATRHYLARHGRPVAFYTDKHSVFKINHKNALSGSGLTQFGRAMRELDIEIICANTPQAKGRVERALGTLQDRLVKELRLQGISSIAQANGFAVQYMQEFNQRFSVQPRSNHNAHRECLFSQEELDIIFSKKDTRTLSKNLTLQYQNVVYQILSSRPTYALRKAQVTVCENDQGDISILYKGNPLLFSVYRKQEKQSQVVSSKGVNAQLNKVKKASKPAANHPWRNYGYHLDGTPIKKSP